MLALYTEVQLGAAYQIYARAHAGNELDALPFEEFRKTVSYTHLTLPTILRV